MQPLRSGVLAAWATAWLIDSGATAPDEVLRAVRDDDAPHLVSGLTEEPVPLTAALIAWRQQATSVRLLLPAPGDLRGLPTEAEFRAAALEAGEAVVGGTLALVPEIDDHGPSSAPTSVVWRAFTVEPVPLPYLDVAGAQQELSEAIRECAAAFTAADVAGGSDAIAPALSAARRASESLRLPPGYPPRAVALLAQASRMKVAVELAQADPQGGAVDRFGMSARAGALRPLATAARLGLLAGYNALAPA